MHANLQMDSNPSQIKRKSLYICAIFEKCESLSEACMTNVAELKKMVRKERLH